MGGEKIVDGFVGPFMPGSPPHGRGKVPETYRYVAGYGITPAWAGKSTNYKIPRFFVWDHPRMGGEKLNMGTNAANSEGSPPHGRGKVKLNKLRESRARITPAWAGKSFGLNVDWFGFEDHPRMGGEKTKKIP